MFYNFFFEVKFKISGTEMKAITMINSVDIMFMPIMLSLKKCLV